MNKKRILGAFILFIAIVPVALVIFTQIRYSQIEEAEAVIIVADYLDSWIEGYRSSSLVIHCAGQKLMKVRWNCTRVADNLKSVEPGEKLTIKTHPRGQYIMSIQCGDTTILSFESSLRAMRTERIVFLIIALAVYSLLLLLFALRAPFKSKARPQP